MTPFIICQFLLLCGVCLTCACFTHKTTSSIQRDSRDKRTTQLFRAIINSYRQKKAWLHQHRLVRDLFPSSSVSVPQCGHSPPEASPRILGGRQTHSSLYPWVATLHLPPYTCSGSLVSPSHVLTAAHCSFPCHTPPCPGVVSLGKSHRYVVRVARHPLYHQAVGPHPPRYDIAVVKLHRAVSLLPICLPASGLRLEGMMGTVVAGEEGSTLRVAEVPLLGRKECQEQPGGGRPSVDQVCGGRSLERQAPCVGDSGAPLMVQDSRGGGWVLGGLVSYGPEVCGVAPVIYSRLEVTLPWLKKELDTH